MEQAEGGGRARWSTAGVTGASFALSRAPRDVLLGTDPPVRLTQRARRVLAEVRADGGIGTVHPAGTVVARNGNDLRWWTWAGYCANATLAATLSGLTDGTQRFDDTSIRLRTDLTREMWKAGTADATARLCQPEVDDRALTGLKFSDALPHRPCRGHPGRPSRRPRRRVLRADRAHPLPLDKNLAATRRCTASNRGGPRIPDLDDHLPMTVGSC